LTASANPSRTCWPSAARRTRQGHDHTDLDFFPARRPDRLPTLNKTASPANFKSLFHDFSLIGGHARAENHASLTPQAYSDGGVRRKQRCGKSASAKPACKRLRQLFENLKNLVESPGLRPVAVLTCGTA